MRILIATPYRSIIGGVETYLQALIPALLQRGHDVAMLYQQPDHGESGRVDPAGARIPVWHSSHQLSSPDAARELVDWNPEIVYSHCPESADFERFLLANYPCVLHIHNYWGTCITGQKCHAVPQTRACNREFGIACLALYYPRRCGGLNPLTALRMFQAARQRKSRLNEYRRIVVSSMHMYREYERHGIDSRNLRLIAYPLTDARLEKEPYAPKELGGKLLFTGRLTKLKGADHLIRAIPEAARRLKRTLTVSIVGDGPDRGRLENVARQAGVDARFLGWLSGDQKLAVMRESNLLVVPSQYPEPFALVGIEAGCLSVPAAAYALGGIPDWLVPGLNGELASGEPPAVGGLADAIVTALSDPDHYARLSRSAWECSRRFTMYRHLKQLESTLEEALGETHQTFAHLMTGKFMPVTDNRNAVAAQLSAPRDLEFQG